MSEHSTSTKMTNSHASTPLGSVDNTLNNQHHQKIEPIDYTADESMIADFMAVLPQLDPSDSSSNATSPTLKLKGQSNESTKKFDAFAAAVQQQFSTVQSSSSSPPTNQLDYQNNKRRRKIERPAQKRIRGSYKLVSPEQKVRIHEYAEKHGVKAASKLFQVAPSTILHAIRNKEAHSRILEWIQTRQENGERVNNRDFHSYALATMRELTGNPDFAASRSWCSNFIKKYNIQLDSDKQTDSGSAQFRFDSVDENASESSQCYMGGNSPADVLSDDDDMNTNHHGDNQGSPNSDQTENPSNSLSPSQITNGLDDVSTTTPIGVKLEQENEFNSPSPSSPSVQTLPNKINGTTSSSSKRLTGTLNRLLHSVINRPNGHHYHQNGLSSSPSASSSTTTPTTTTGNDSNTKEPKGSLEMSTQSIETFVQHFDSSFNTMTYFQEKLQQLLVSIAQERDTYRTLYLKEHDRRIAAELRLKETNNTVI
ncbi:hypothetical protein I4U23_017764 [Adineta vaga]|nr:hypothetical protein I4U23_017764 [Adineta vaga]